MASVVYRLLKNRGVFFYTLFIGYLITVHPSLIERLSKVSSSNPDPLLGWIFLMIPFLELAGFWFKYPLLTHYSRNHRLEPSNWSIVVMVLLPILHLGMSALLFIIGTQMAGLQPEGNAPWYWQLLYVVGFFLIIIKEAGFLIMFFTFGGIKWTANQEYPPEIPLLKRLRKTIQEIRLQHLFEDAFGDILLLIFSSLGYSALWEYVGMSSPFHTSAGFWGYFYQLIGVLVYFMMVIPPLQAVYLLRDTIVRTTKRQKLWSGFQFALTLVAAFLSIAQS